MLSILPPATCHLSLCGASTKSSWPMSLDARDLKVGSRKADPIKMGFPEGTFTRLLFTFLRRSSLLEVLCLRGEELVAKCPSLQARSHLFLAPFILDRVSFPLLTRDVNHELQSISPPPPNLPCAIAPFLRMFDAQNAGNSNQQNQGETHILNFNTARKQVIAISSVWSHSRSQIAEAYDFSGFDDCHCGLLRLRSAPNLSCGGAERNFLWSQWL